MRINISVLIYYHGLTAVCSVCGWLKEIFSCFKNEEFINQKRIKWRKKNGNVMVKEIGMNQNPLTATCILKILFVRRSTQFDCRRKCTPTPL